MSVCFSVKQCLATKVLFLQVNNYLLVYAEHITDGSTVECYLSCPLIVQTVALWDLRNLKLKLHSFESHKDEIFQVT